LRSNDRAGVPFQSICEVADRVQFVAGAKKWYKRLATHRGVARMQQDVAYFVRRAAQEQAAAQGAADAKVREAHEQMAAHYQALIRSAAKADAAA
jgi:hypothetical protein